MPAREVSLTSHNSRDVEETEAKARNPRVAEEMRMCFETMINLNMMMGMNNDHELSIR